MNTRRFKLVRHLTFPLDLHAAPGAKHRTAEPGDEVEIDSERCQEFDRFIRGRIRSGDMVELGPEFGPAANMSAAARKE